MQDFLHVSTGQVASAGFLRTQGINPENPVQVLAGGYEPITTVELVYDHEVYFARQKGELKKIDGGWLRELELHPYDVDHVREVVKSRVTSQRWDCETGGIVIDGVEILSGIDDQNRIDSVVNGMATAGMEETVFKAANGWVTVSLEELKGIQVTLVHHVEDCFKHEKELHEQCDACSTVEELVAIDVTAGWPAREKA